MVKFSSAGKNERHEDANHYVYEVMENDSGSESLSNEKIN